MFPTVGGDHVMLRLDKLFACRLQRFSLRTTEETVKKHQCADNKIMGCGCGADVNSMFLESRVAVEVFFGCPVLRFHVDGLAFRR